MARLNPKRRLLAQQAKVLREAQVARFIEGDDSYKLQQGQVGSSMAKFANSGTLKAPREQWEGSGKPVRNPNVVKRFSITK